MPVTVVDEPGPLVAAAGDPGFIVAPSLDQASTAALLREAHLAHGGNDDSPYAITLKLRPRAPGRAAVRRRAPGHPARRLLGYDVERRLHDAVLDELIDDLRRIAPPPGTTGDEAVARRTQLDGLVLQRSWGTTPRGVLAQIDGLTVDDPRRDAWSRRLRGSMRRSTPPPTR